MVREYGEKKNKLNNKKGVPVGVGTPYPLVNIENIHI